MMPLDSLTHFSSRFALCVCVVLSLFSVACGDTVDETNNGTSCAPGETENPITGECVAPTDCGPNEYEHEITGECVKRPGTVEERDLGGDEPDTGMPDMGKDLQDMTSDLGGDDADMDPIDMDPVDMGPDCREGVDNDNDGLDNACECTWGRGLDVNDPDSDGDGLLDGEEDTDASCGFSPGETDPRSADTDSDGLDDKTERDDPRLDPLLSDSDNDGLRDDVEVAGCTEPDNDDSDSDGIKDGVEDGNGDGAIGTCPAGMYDVACAAGESDPCSDDTDGDGVLDIDEVAYRQCRPSDTATLVTPQLISDIRGDYQLALETSATAQPLASAQPISGHVFEDPTHHYTGFIASLTSPATGATAPRSGRLCLQSGRCALSRRYETKRRASDDDS